MLPRCASLPRAALLPRAASLLQHRLLASSKAWRKAQQADEYVLKAAREGYRSRAAYKLMQIDRRMRPRLLKEGHTCIELGSAPGSWTQVLVQNGLEVVAVDLLPAQPVKGAHFIQGDFTDDGVQVRLLELLRGRQVDFVLSDMSPNRSGNRTLGVFARSLENLCEYLHPTVCM